MEMKGFGKFIRGRAFEGIFTIFALLSIFYVSDRIGRCVKSFFGYDLSAIVFVVLVVLMGYMLLYIQTKKEKKTTRNLYETCSVIVCFLLYLVLLFWVYDIGTMLLSVNQDKWYLLPIICSIVLTFYGFFHAKKLYVKEYDIFMDGVKKQQHIVLLSDIHVGTFVDFRQLEKIVSKVNQMRADMIVIAGDLFDVDAFAYCDKEQIAKILRQFQSKGKIYAVLGNHDPGSATNEIRSFYQEAQIKLLIDEAEETDDFVLIGRDDVTMNPRRKPLQEIRKKFGSEKPHIVLDHNPLGIQEAVKQKVDMILCGHTHKGQFFPANIFTKLAYGKQGYYGYFQEEQTQSIVSSGAGFFQMPMRIGSNSEIVVLHIQAKHL